MLDTHDFSITGWATAAVEYHISSNSGSTAKLASIVSSMVLEQIRLSSNLKILINVCDIPVFEVVWWDSKIAFLHFEKYW